MARQILQTSIANDALCFMMGTSSFFLSLFLWRSTVLLVTIGWGFLHPEQRYLNGDTQKKVSVIFPNEVTHVSTIFGGEGEESELLM